MLNYKDIIKKIKPELEKIIHHLEKEIRGIQVGHASASLVEDIVVDYLGAKVPLKQLSAISCPESRQIVIQPWDKSYFEPIEKAISYSNIGANPIVDKDIIRINLPPLTEEYRKGLLRLLSQRKEESRESIRKWRDEDWKEVQDNFKSKKISEDDKFRAKDELQDLIDEYNEKIQKIIDKKEKEISG